MKKTSKIKEFFTTDIKSINSYLLIAVITIVVMIIGSTSYALFSYEQTSPNSLILTVADSGSISLKIYGQTNGTDIGTIDYHQNVIKFNVLPGYVMDEFSCTTGTATYDGYNNILTVTDATTNGTCTVTFKEGTMLDTSGANRPELATGMIPVYYDSTSKVWRKADSENITQSCKWYNYDEHMWANAVTVGQISTTATTLNYVDGTSSSCTGTADKCQRSDYVNAPLGTEIPITDINTMLVWIPRFNAVVPASQGVIDVTFVDKNTTAIDAFDFGGNISGFWVGKFELTGTLVSACTNETCNISNVAIKPNTASLINQTVSSFFYAMRSMEQASNQYGLLETEVDTHMMKNSEWGAVTYLTQSNYGRCTSNVCSEVWINPVNTLNGAASQYGPSITGCSGASVSAAIQNSKSACTSGYEYNGANNNGNSSTTGNVYGVYDMSGGTWEYVMGNYNSTIKSGNFSTTTNPLWPNEKYINIYNGSSYQGHALTETAGWDGDYSSFVSAGYPWFIRGGGCYSGGAASVFNFYSNNGSSSTYHCSARLTITK